MPIGSRDPCRFDRAAALAAPLVAVLACVASAGQPPPPTFAARWSVSLSAPASPGAAASPGALHVAHREGRITTLDLVDGKPLWEVDGSPTVPLVVADSLLLVAEDRTLVARDAAGGAERWRVTLEASIAGAPLPVESVVFVPLASGTLAIVSLADGASVGDVSLGSAPAVAVIRAGPRLVVAAEDGAVTALGPDDHRPVWRATLKARPTVVSATARDVVVATTGGHLVGLDAADGGTRWRWRVNAGVVGVPLLDGARVYYLALDNQLRALDRGNGHQQWKRALPIRPSFGPLRLDGWLLAAGLAAEVRVHRVTDGRPVAAIAVPDELTAPPLVVPIDDQGGQGLVLFLAGGAVRLVAPVAPAEGGRGATAVAGPAKR